MASLPRPCRDEMRRPRGVFGWRRAGGRRRDCAATVAALVLLAAAAGPAAGACLDVLGKWGWGPSRAVEFANGTLFAGMGSMFVVVGGMPNGPTFVRGSVTLPDVVRAVAVAGTQAAVACGDSGVFLVSVADPAHPFVAGSLNTPGTALDVAVAGPLVYVADDIRGLLIVDATDPAAPFVVGSYDTPGEAAGVEVAAGRAYVADWWRGLAVIDVSNPAAPTLLGAIDPAGDWMDVAVQGTVAFGLKSFGGLVAFDVANPAAITQLGTAALDGTSYRVTLAGNRAYVAGSSGVTVIDVAAPANPVRRYAYDPDPTDLEGASDVAVAGEYVYWAEGSNGPRSARITSLSSMQAVAALAARGATRGFTLAKGHLIVANGIAGFRVLDIDDLSAIAEVGVYDEAIDSATATVVRVNTAYMLDVRWGLHTVDITTLASPTKVHWLGLANCSDLADGGRYLYLACSFGLNIADLVDPKKPTALPGLVTPQFGGTVLLDTPSAVALTGTRLVLAEEDKGIQVLDVANPAAPTALGSLNLGTWAEELDIIGSRALVAATGGLEVVDLSNPAMPRFEGEVDQSMEGVAVDDGRVLASGYGVLSLVGLSDPTAPVELLVRRLGSAGQPPLLDGDRAFVPLNEAGFAVVDLSGCPASPCSYTSAAAATPAAGAPPLTVQFTASLASTCPMWPEYEWRFGDGSPWAFVREPVHTYAAAGTYAWEARISPGGRGAYLRKGTVTVQSGPEITVRDGAATLASGQAAAVDLGAAALGGPEPARVFTVRNDGNGPLTLAAPALPAGFTLAEPLAASLAAGEQDAFTVALSTAAAGARSGLVSIASNDADESPFTFPIAGVVSAAPPLRYDFGTAASPVAAGRTGVAHTTTYAAERGYGWLAGTIGSRDRAVGGPLTRDLNLTEVGTFVVDLKSGTYEVTAVVGDPAAAHDEMGVYLEGALADTVTTATGQLVTRTWRVVVTDGRLTVLLDDLGGSDPNVVINALSVARVEPRPRLGLGAP
jgi:hypothetical protein